MSISKIFVNTKDTGFEGMPLQIPGETTTVAMSQNASTKFLDIPYGFGYLRESDGYYVRPNTLGRVTDRNWLLTDYVKVKQGDRFKLCLKNNPDNINLVRIINYYDIDKNIISYQTAEQNGIIEIPSGVSFVRFGGATSLYVQYTPVIQRVLSSKQLAELGENFINSQNFDTLDITEKANISGYYSGLTLVNNTNYLTSEPIEITSYPAIILVHQQYQAPVLIELNEDLELVKSNILTNNLIESVSIDYIIFDKNTKYIRINKAVENQTQRFLLSKEASISFVSDLKNQVELLAAGYFTEEHDYLQSLNVLGEYFSMESQKVVGDYNWMRSQFIPCKQGDIFDCALYCHNLVSSVSVFDKDLNLLTVWSPLSEETTPPATVDRFVSFQKEITGFNATYVVFSTAAESHKPEYYPYYSIKSSKYFNIFDYLSSPVFKGIFTATSVDFSDQFKNVGFVRTDGVSIYVDNNWRYSNLIIVSAGDAFNFAVTGHTAIGSVVIYDASMNPLRILSAESDGVPFAGTVEITEQAAAFIRFTTANPEWQGSAVESKILLDANVTYNVFDTFKSERIIDPNSDQEHQTYSIIVPRTVYSVANDIPNKTTNVGRNRNLAASIYLDHMFALINKEPNVRFKDAVDRIDFCSPIVVTNYNEESPSAEVNNGQNKIELTRQISFKGSDKTFPSSFTVIHRSTKNSATELAHPKVLCIGDSITYGEQATIAEDNFSINHAYHLITKQLYMKDKIDNGGNNFDITFLGHFTKQAQFSYKNQTYTAKSCHEGIRGIGMVHYLNGSVEAFKSDQTNKFSVNAWLSKYRTLDDDGNRLPWSAPGATVTGQDGKTYTIGTLITSQQMLESIEVCTPTHIVIMLGMNGGATVAQHQEMIQIIQSEIQNCIIGIVVADCAGTLFPSLHPNCSEQCTMWNDNKNGQGTRHSQQYTMQSSLQAEFDKASYEQQGIYMLPFFYVTPTAEGVSFRTAPLPDSELSQSEKLFRHEHYGWCASTHMNGYGHANWGYCLYSWLKYTS